VTKTDDIKNRRPIRLSTVNVLRRLHLSEDECRDEITIRRFCAQNQQTLPGQVDIRVEPKPDNDDLYAWTISVWELPDAPEDIAALQRERGIKNKWACHQTRALATALISAARTMGITSR
jgi:hypothetical protein